MRKILIAVVLTFIALFFISGIALALGGTTTTDPNPYEIIVKKVELRNSVTLEYVTAGEGDMTINIASVDAGQLAAGYVSGAAIPEGTYDKVRVTLSRDVSIKTSYTDTTGAFGNVAGATYYTTSTTNTDGSIVASTTAGDYAEGTAKIPADGGIKVDVTAGTYTDIYDLLSIITIAKGSTQKVRVRFDVSGAATFQNTGVGTALAYPTVPDVDVTIVD